MKKTQRPRLETLLARLPEKTILCGAEKGVFDLEVIGIVQDSRHASPGSVFVAIIGERVDGHDYVGDAVAGGCGVVVGRSGRLQVAELNKRGVTVVEVPDTARAYAELCCAFFGDPGEKMVLVGITGTNGKTTTTYLVEQVLRDANRSVGVIGTVNNRYTPAGGKTRVLPTRFTTPEPFLLQKLLAEMADVGVEYVVMEVSSHALSQKRVGGLSFQVAAFTNLSRDHLDYHGEMGEYFAAKKQLFRDYLKPGGLAVIPDEPAGPGRALRQICGERAISCVTWGKSATADLQWVASEPVSDGTRVKLSRQGEVVELTSPLFGEFNVENLIVAMGICNGLGLSLPTVASSLEQAHGAPGRVERVTTNGLSGRKEPLVFVDYAHTPDALEKVLVTLGSIPHQRLFCVFGCGGDRDRGKRSPMGQTALKYSDVPVLTSDNPRSEDPERILDDIMEGFDTSGCHRCTPEEFPGPSGKKSYYVISDRAEAIAFAIARAESGDIVLIAGKGHESYQIVGNRRLFFDDRTQALHHLMRWNLASLCEAGGGKLDVEVSKERYFNRIVTDSRISGKDTVFVALRGENHDGHDFVAQAVENGAGALLVDHPVDLSAESGDAKAVPQIVVKDTEWALGELARFRAAAIRKLSKAPLVGITGSCGKTTVKEMCAAIFSVHWGDREHHPADPVLKTVGNFNNLIGVPLSLLPMEVFHRIAVIEMGANHAGELARLGEITSPDIACITNIRGAHLEGFGSIDGVAAAKAELFGAVRENGVLAVNLDDPRVVQAAADSPSRILRYSTHRVVNGMAADIWSSEGELLETGCWKFRLHFGSRDLEVALRVAGEHNISNGLAAAAIAYAVGVPPEEIQAGLERFRPADKRMEILGGGGKPLIINDTYNANPASMAAGIKTLCQIADGRKIAVLGDMFELGQEAEKAHRELGQLVAASGVDYLFAIGSYAHSVMEGAVVEGMEHNRICADSSKDRVFLQLRQLLEETRLGDRDAILVKASRGMRLETIVEQLTKIVGCGTTPEDTSTT